jgi:chemotaxis protein methyltransferase CheR
MREYTVNYIAAGGTRAFSEYYAADGTMVRFHPWLARNLVFAQHNLVSDSSFNEFNLILCRNVMIYFDKTLQAHVHGLLHESLGSFGVLGLGHRESVRFSGHEDCYETVDPVEKLYRRVR